MLLCDCDDCGTKRTCLTLSLRVDRRAMADRLEQFLHLSDVCWLSGGMCADPMSHQSGRYRCRVVDLHYTCQIFSWLVSVK